MNINYKFLLAVASILMFIIALAHIYIALVGGPLYLYFGAGEDMYQMDISGSVIPKLSTLILSVFFLFLGFIGLSGAEVIRKIPFLKQLLFGTSALFILRGFVFFYELFLLFTGGIPHGTRFLFFSLYALAVGLLYIFGTLKKYSFLNQ